MSSSPSTELRRLPDTPDARPSNEALKLCTDVPYISSTQPGSAYTDDTMVSTPVLKAAHPPILLSSNSFLASPATIGTNTASASASVSRKTSLTSLTLDALPSNEPVHEKLRIRMACAFVVFFVCGWGDGVTGTALPLFTSDFHLSYMVSSLCFVASTLGFATGTVVIDRVLCVLGAVHPRADDKKSRISRTASALKYLAHMFFSSPGIQSICRARSLSLLIASMFHAGFFVLMGTSRSFSFVFAGYALAAFARAFLTATINAYVASTPKRPLGQLHAFWAFGAFIAPFVCQTVIAHGVPWQHFYLGSLALSAINTSLIAYAFRPTAREYATEGHSPPSVDDSCSENTLAKTTAQGDPVSPDDVYKSVLSAAEKATVSSSKESTIKRTDSLRYTLGFRHVWTFSFFVFIYAGSETTTQGYMATYLLAVRHGNPKTVGYVTSGFWAGMTISRLASGILSPRLSFTQRKYILHVLMCAKSIPPVALAMHLLIWFVDNIFENAFSASIVGLMYGPIFPCALALAIELLPKEIHLLTMAIMCGFANLGTSVFPFLTGALSNIRSPQVLTYVTVSQMGSLVLLWFFFPSRTPSSTAPAESTIDREKEKGSPLEEKAVKAGKMSA